MNIIEIRRVNPTTFAFHKLEPDAPVRPMVARVYEGGEGSYRAILVSSKGVTPLPVNTPDLTMALGSVAVTLLVDDRPEGD